MKIYDTNAVRPAGVSSTRKKRDAGSVDFMTFLSEAGESGSVSEAPPMESVAATSMDAMMALQEMPEGEINRKKAISRGQSALDQLENLRHGLLMGRVPAYILRNLSNLLAAQKAQNLDPRLTEIIEEIEIRAAVELAKLEMAQKNSHQD